MGVLTDQCVMATLTAAFVVELFKLQSGAVCEVTHLGTNVQLALCRHCCVFNVTCSHSAKEGRKQLMCGSKQCGMKVELVFHFVV